MSATTSAAPFSFTAARADPAAFRILTGDRPNGSRGEAGNRACRSSKWGINSSR